MLQVNLIPDGRSRRRRGTGLSLPSFSGLPDKWFLAAGIAVIAALSAGTLMWLGTIEERADLEVRLEDAVRDSSRFADLIARTAGLTARRDSIFEKVGIIQEIDRDRYTWPHILDEVARALPDYTWLTEIVQVQETPVRIQISGRAGNIFAITVFMNQLQASPFFSQVKFLSSQESIASSGGSIRQAVQEFRLEVDFHPVPLGELETVPLFGVDERAHLDGEPRTALQEF